MSNNKKLSEKKEMTKEERLYHNTEILLRHYRDVIFNIQISAEDALQKFDPLVGGCEMKEFLEKSYQAGIDVSGIRIEAQVRSMERNKKMINIINSALDLLRKEPNNGEMYYLTLYYTYIHGDKRKKIEDAIACIEDETNESLSRKRYYKLRNKAIEILSYILWGFTSKEFFLLLDGPNN